MCHCGIHEAEKKHVVCAMVQRKQDPERLASEQGIWLLNSKSTNGPTTTAPQPPAQGREKDHQKNHLHKDEQKKHVPRRQTPFKKGEQRKLFFLRRRKERWYVHLIQRYDLSNTYNPPMQELRR
jgi:hypothetical protein